MDSLSEAVEWIYNQNDNKKIDINLLEVLKDLSPPAHGLIEKTELKGTILGNDNTLILTRDNRQTISKEIIKQQSLEKKMHEFKGKVREFDKDNLTFIFRGPAIHEEMKCSFKEDHFDDLFEAFSSDISLSIIVKKQNSRKTSELIAFELISGD